MHLKEVSLGFAKVTVYQHALHLALRVLATDHVAGILR
jgi:hypothetical protein